MVYLQNMNNTKVFKGSIKTLVIALFMLGTWQLQGQTPKRLENSFLRMVEQIKADSNKVLLNTLMPTDEEVRLVFLDSVADKAVAYNTKMWSNFAKISDDSMKPLSQEAGVRILSTNMEMLGKGELGGMPEEYGTFDSKLRPGVSMFRASLKKRVMLFST